MQITRAVRPFGGLPALPMRWLLLSFLLAACSQPPLPPTTASSIYTNARIWTGDPEQPWAHALAIQGNQIVAVGTAGELANLADETTEMIDLSGAFVAPGFIDNHVHMIDGGDALSSVDLRPATTPEDLAQRLADFAADRDPANWITGGDWDHEQWGGELPMRDWIDTGTGDVPVFVRRMDGHMALANSAALELAGITRDTASPDGGEIVRDASGEPTGVLKDNAMGLVYNVIPPLSDEALENALAAASSEAASRGVTQVHDMSASPTVLDAYRRLQADGRLKTRVYGAMLLSRWDELADYIDAHGRGDRLVRWGMLKGFVDGSLGSTTAWFYDPFDDAPETSGFPVADTLVLRERILAADSAGLQVAVHAIGDRANDWLLRTYAETANSNGPRDRRFRIEHAQHLTPLAIQRFAELGVIPSMQPYHAIDDGRWAERRIGERIQTTYPFRSLLDASAPLTFGSDWFVAPLDPLLGIYAAVTRRTLDDANPGGWVPEQKVTVDEALRAYTAANAYAGFQTGQGVLRAGALADFVVLSDNLFEIDPVAIRDVEVLRTVVGGREVYELTP
ncbi:MAG: amidohydrolase [Rubricoccaceae bacterium]